MENAQWKLDSGQWVVDSGKCKLAALCRVDREQWTVHRGQRTVDSVQSKVPSSSLLIYTAKCKHKIFSTKQPGVQQVLCLPVAATGSGQGVMVENAQWKLDSGQWVVDSGKCKLAALCRVDREQWTVHRGQRTVDSVQSKVPSSSFLTLLVNGLTKPALPKLPLHLHEGIPRQSAPGRAA